MAINRVITIVITLVPAIVVVISIVTIVIAIAIVIKKVIVTLLGRSRVRVQYLEPSIRSTETHKRHHDSNVYLTASLYSRIVHSFSL